MDLSLIVHRELESAYAPWAKWTAVAAYLAVVAVAVSLFQFNAPLADDYCTAASPQTLAQHIATLYGAWSGRWVSHGLEHLALTRIDPTRNYGALTALLGLALGLSVWLLARSVFRNILTSGLIVSLSCGFLVLFWCLHPSLGQGFYWFTGAVEYQLVFSLALVLFAALLSESVAVSRGAMRASYVLGLSLLAFLVAGMHELFATMLCIALAAGAVATHRFQHRNRGLLVVVFLAAFAGFVVAAAAPGNLVRTASFAGERDWSLALWLAPWQAIKAGTKWVCDPKLIAATVALLIHPRVRAAQPAWLAANPSCKWIVPAAWLALLAVGFAMPTFAMGQEMPGRALGGIFSVFLLGWFLSAFVLTRDSRPLASLGDRDLRRVGSVFLCLFAVSILTTGNARDGIHDLIHTATNWNHAMHERYEIIREGKRAGTITIPVPPAPQRPRLFFQGPSEITADSTDWKNACMASYFVVPAVRVERQETTAGEGSIPMDSQRPR